jgi:hypothetical protein
MQNFGGTRTKTNQTPLSESFKAADLPKIAQKIEKSIDRKLCDES